MYYFLGLNFRIFHQHRSIFSYVIVSDNKILNILAVVPCSGTSDRSSYGSAILLRNKNYWWQLCQAHLKKNWEVDVSEVTQERQSPIKYFPRDISSLVRQSFVRLGLQLPQCPIAQIQWYVYAQHHHYSGLNHNFSLFSSCLMS